jgi:subtilase family serine protease
MRGYISQSVRIKPLGEGGTEAMQVRGPITTNLTQVAANSSLVDHHITAISMLGVPTSEGTAAANQSCGRAPFIH